MRKIGKLTRKIIRINYKKWQNSLISWIFDIKKNRDKSKVWRKSQFIKLRKKGKIINIPNSLLTGYKANSIISAIVEYWEARVREAAVDQPQNQVTIPQQCVQRAQLIEQQPRILLPMNQWHKDQWTQAIKSRRANTSQCCHKWGTYKQTY